VSSEGGRWRRLGIGNDIGLTAVMQFLSALLTFVFQAVVVRSLSKEETGLYFLAMTYIVIATSIADFGIVAIVLPRVSVARGMETPAFKSGLVVRVLAMAVAWIGINLYLLAFSNVLVILAVNAGFSAILFSSKFSGIRQYLEIIWRLQGRTYIITIIGVIDIMVSLAIAMLLKYTGHLTAASAWLSIPLGSIPGFLVVSWPLVRRLRQSDYFRRRIPLAYYRRVALAAIPMAVMVILGQTFAQLEVLVINSRLTLADVGAFSTAFRPISGTLFLAVIVGAGIFPVVSQIHAGSRREVSLDYIVSVSVRLVGLMGLGIIAICILFDTQIMSIFGADYIAEAYLLVLNSLINCLTFLVVLFDHLLLSTGKRVQTLMGASFSFVLAMVLEFSLVGSFGIQGVIYAKMAAIASLVAFQLYVVGERIRRPAFEGLRKLVIPAATLGFALLATSHFSLVLRAVAVLAVFAGAVVTLRTFSISELQLLRTIRAT
jgi:O-antigen/teichoic acid export membrane protein